MKRILSLILSVCLVTALLCACSPSTPDGSVDAAATVMMVGDAKVPLYEYNYTYYNCYAQFCSGYSYYLSYLGLDTETPLKEQTCSISDTENQTWADFFMDQTDDLLQQVYTFYNEAVSEGKTLSDVGNEQLEAYVLSAKENAEDSEVSLDEYLTATFGSGMNEARLREVLGRRLLASEYCNELLDSLDYTDERYESYYSEHRDDIDRVSFRIYTLTSDNLPSVDEDATEEALKAAVKALAEDFANGLTTEEQFVLRSQTYAPEDQKDVYADASATLGKGYSYSDLSSNAELCAWLFDADRKACDVGITAGSSGAYNVCMFLSRSRIESPLAGMRHILLSVTETEENGETVSDDAEVLARAKALFDTWKANGGTEEAFSALVKENTDDTSSAETGGLYEDFSRDTMMPEIDTWIWADGRQEGDCEIVRTDYGYHLVYFLGYGETAWKSECYTGMQDEDFYSLYADFSAKYPTVKIDGYRDLAGNDEVN